ncbi:MAG TPA: hypothetical protein VJ463_06555 [Geothrix sp.]|nr:hypothetical protein [Geothrix sp.]
MDAGFEWVRERWRGVAVALLAGGLALATWRGRALTQPAGVLAPEDPVQTDPEAPGSWTHRGHRLTALAGFQLHARVLGVERYRHDRPAEISPVDLALGWGPMSDSRVLEAITVRQQDRWYFWSAKRLPIPEGDIARHSANMHMIPADAAVARRLLAARPGQLVTLRGQLVRVDGADGFHWVSSLSRADTGDGSCEVVWVESASLADH